MNEPLLLIAVALPAEARPLIDRYQLQKIQCHTAFAVYENQQLSVALIVSGVGKISMAAATAYAAAIYIDRSLGLINVGLAGSNTYSLGASVLAHKIVEQGNDRVFYPEPFKNFQSDLLVTMNAANKEYEFPLIDMEASGFFQTAIRFADQENVQVLKIVSDNKEQDYHALDKKLAVQLITDALPEISAVIEKIQKQLLNFSEKNKSPWQQLIMAAHHFTHYQQYQLQELLRRWQVFLPEKNPLLEISDAKNSQQFLHGLMQYLEDLDYHWDEHATHLC